MLNGTVPPGGADWQTIQADGFTELDTRYMIKTNKGVVVYVQNGGIRTAAPDVMQKLLGGQAVDPKLVIDNANEPQSGERFSRRSAAQRLYGPSNHALQAWLLTFAAAR